MFNRLMALNQEAFEKQSFDVAYHALAAALHAARDDHDESGLSAVATAATMQIEWIDEHAPEYHHSTASAHRRNNENIFSLLVRQSESQQKMLLRQRHVPSRTAI